MIFMPMRDDHSLNLVFPLCQESGVRQDLVHAQVRETAVCKCLV